MELISIANSSLDENTYIVYEDNIGLVIDPGSDFEIISEKIDKAYLKDIYIYLTHGHFDHMMSALKLAKKYNAPILAYKDEIKLIKDPELNMSRFAPIIIDKVEPVTDKLTMFDEDIIVYHTPGHTSGHSMLEVKSLNALFTGDFIFRREIGRCDLPTGSLKEMYASLRKLAKMDPTLKIYPGHGPATILGEEIAQNKYIALALQNK